MRENFAEFEALKCRISSITHVCVKEVVSLRSVYFLMASFIILNESVRIENQNLVKKILKELTTKQYGHTLLQKNIFLKIKFHSFFYINMFTFLLQETKLTRYFQQKNQSYLTRNTFASPIHFRCCGCGCTIRHRSKL